MVRKGLGRGLSTLLGDRSPAVFTMEPDAHGPPTPAAESSGVHEIPVRAIEPNPFQPRTEIDPTALDELASSIRQHGLLEPLLVREHAELAGHYQMIAGERRWRAAQIAGMERVPALVREAADSELLEIAIIENIQREDLNPIEEARAFRSLMEGIGEGGAGLTQQEVADRVGKSRAAVANLLRLLDLPEYVQTSIQMGVLSQGHGKILAGLDEDTCRKAWSYSTEQNASVRELEHFLSQSHPRVEKKSKRASSTQASQPLDIHWKAIQEALHERLRAKISVRHNKDDSGVLEIHFFNKEDLDRILESLDIEL